MEESFIVIFSVVSEKRRGGGEERPPMPKYRKNTPCEIGLNQKSAYLLRHLVCYTKVLFAKPSVKISLGLERVIKDTQNMEYMIAKEDLNFVLPLMCL